MLKLNINGKEHELDIDPSTPLLWVLRDYLNLTGTKYGCGINQCGACTVQVNGVSIRSCQITAKELEQTKIVTIEGLSNDNSHPIQQAWIEEDVPQCGYCQSGQIMAAAALLQSKPNPTDADIDKAMTNVCRCGTYQRIRVAIHKAASVINS